MESTNLFSTLRSKPRILKVDNLFHKINYNLRLLKFIDHKMVAGYLRIL